MTSPDDVSSLFPKRRVFLFNFKLKNEEKCPRAHQFNDTFVKNQIRRITDLVFRLVCQKLPPMEDEAQMCLTTALSLVKVTSTTAWPSADCHLLVTSPNNVANFQNCPKFN